MSSGPPEPEAPAPGQLSEPEYGSSLGQDTFCQGKADGLYPNPLDWSSYYKLYRGAVVPAKLPEEPGVQLLLQMLHLELSLQGPFGPSTWARAQDHSIAHLPSSPWQLQSSFLCLSISKLSVLSLGFLLFCSSWAAYFT